MSCYSVCLSGCKTQVKINARECQRSLSLSIKSYDLSRKKKQIQKKHATEFLNLVRKWTSCNRKNNRFFKTPLFFLSLFQSSKILHEYFRLYPSDLVLSLFMLELRLEKTHRTGSWKVNGLWVIALRLNTGCEDHRLQQLVLCPLINLQFLFVGPNSSSTLWVNVK